MPYFSIPVPQSTLHQSHSFTKFETVVHQSHQTCSAAAEKIQAEFNSAMNTDIVTNTIADVPGLGRVHFLAFTIPNCLPERLVALVRFAEFTLLNDGKCWVRVQEQNKKSLGRRIELTPDRLLRYCQK